jgi:hypothetical protein
MDLAAHTGHARTQNTSHACDGIWSPGDNTCTHATVVAPPHAQGMRQEVGSRRGPEPGQVADLVDKLNGADMGGQTQPQTRWVPPLGAKV